MDGANEFIPLFTRSSQDSNDARNFVAFSNILSEKRFQTLSKMIIDGARAARPPGLGQQGCQG